MKIHEILNRANKLGSYLITVTLKDDSKSENDLSHYMFRKEFPLDDVIPSLDAAVKSLEVTPPPVPEVKESPAPADPKKPLRIAIITHFNRAPDSYSPGRAAKRIVKMLKAYGHEPVFFTVEGSKLDAGCEMRPVVPKFKREKGVVNEPGKQRTIDMLREELVGFDLAISIDLYIDDCMTYREAIRECGVPICWVHWARSGIGRPIEFGMDNALYVYMNMADSEVFSRRIGVMHDKVRVVFNDADPSIMFGWNDITNEVVKSMRLWEKDVIQVYPVCTTRMDAKGINSVISVFGSLKRAGKKVGLVICNSNGRRRIDDIKRKLLFARDNGLVEGEDILFTSTLPEALGTHSEVPHRTVTELMQVSNLFVFATTAEVCPNILLEASMGKNLIVINDDLPLLKDFTGEHNVLKHPFTSARHLHYSGRSPGDMDDLAKKIVGQLDSNKADRQFRRVWNTHCLDSVYRKQLAPVLYEAAEITKNL